MTEYVRDIDETQFPEAVILRSTELPVVVDFWAPWCGPCRVLGPILEGQIAALGGKVELVKVNTDESPNVAAEFNIQGIPAVKAFRNGEVVAEFVGAHPANFIHDWLTALLPSAGAEALLQAEAAAQSGKSDQAEAAFRALLSDPEVRDNAAVRLARLLLARGKPDEVAPVLKQIDPRSDAAEAIPSIERLVALATHARGQGGEAVALAGLEKDPRDLEARYTLGSALAAKGDFAGALDQFLEVVSRNRKLHEDGARIAMLAIFDQLGNDSVLTQDFRRKLQIVL
jgi:putative thioredoxin